MVHLTMFEAQFIDTQDETLSNVLQLRVGLINRTHSRVVASLLVKNNERPITTIDVFGNPDDYFFKKSVLIWNQYVVVGVGHQVTFVHSVNHETTTTDLGCYFGYLYPMNNFLLVASARYLHCFTDTGKLQWISDELGIDGVIVEQVANGIIHGIGEWDPPGGWQPFNLSLATGK